MKTNNCFEQGQVKADPLNLSISLTTSLIYQISITYILNERLGQETGKVHNIASNAQKHTSNAFSQHFKTIKLDGMNLI